MNRRDLLTASLAAATLGLAPRLASAAVDFTPIPNGWRTFALTTKVEPTFATRAWIPLPTFSESDWQRPGKTNWTSNAKLAERVRDPKYGMEMLRVEWSADQQNPSIDVTTEVQTQDRAVRPGVGKAASLSAEERHINLMAIDLLPVDGIVKETADGIVRGKAKDVDKAQHCRAEVWLSGSGWTPSDPTDVRKVVLEEPPTNLAMADLKVMAARKTLFGAWEGNWLAFNVAHDVKLPGSGYTEALPFLMYPQAEDKSGLVDPLDADAFKYKITAREVKA